MGCFEFLFKWFEYEGKIKDKSIFFFFGESSVIMVVNLGSYVLFELSIKGDVDVFVLFEFFGRDFLSKYLFYSGLFLKLNDFKNFVFYEFRYVMKNFDRKYFLGEGGFG